MAYGGISNKIQLLKETAYADGGAAGEVIFGESQEFVWNVDESTEQYFALESALASPMVNVDGVEVVSGSHTWILTRGSEFEAIMGTKTGTTNFSLSTALTLPSYAAKVVDGDGFRLISGIKYTKFSLTLDRSANTVQIKADWIAKKIAETTTFTPTVETTLPMTFYDGYVSFGATAQTEIDNFTLEINRTLSPRRFIENVTAGDKRHITALIEGVQKITYNGVQAAKTSLMQELYGGAAPADIRTDKNIVLTFAKTGGTALTFTIAGGRSISLGRTMKKDDEVTLGEFGGVGLTITGTGTYPN